MLSGRADDCMLPTHTGARARRVVCEAPWSKWQSHADKYLQRSDLTTCFKPLPQIKSFSKDLDRCARERRRHQKQN